METRVTITGTGSIGISNIDISLSSDQIEELFDEEFEGYCTVCKGTPINEGEIVCCGCLNDALAYHKNTCGCMEEDE
jgi:hypothetical protein